MTAEFLRRATGRADALQPDLVALRRDLHRHPELGWEEFRTSALVATRLRELGLEVLTGADVLVPEDRMGVPAVEELDAAFQRALDEGADPEILQPMRGGLTGVVGTLRNGDGPTIALRFDIDALPMQETASPGHLPSDEGFASLHDGVMHSCGHDAHTTVGLGLAQVMSELREQWSGTLIFLFQPAEEGVRGAKAMVAKGHVDAASVLLASHVNGLPAGASADVAPGTGGTLATTKLDVTFSGRAAHASAAPQEGHNALQAMATAILGLYGISRTAEGDTRVNVGVARAGIGRSSIPASATLQLEVRGATSAANAFMEHRAREVIEHAAGMYGCSYEVTVAGEAISLESDRELYERIAAALPGVGLRPSDPPYLPLTASEDCSFLMERVQSNGGLAAYMGLLTPLGGGLHTVDFDFDERLLAVGVKAFCAAIATTLERG